MKVKCISFNDDNLTYGEFYNVFNTYFLESQQKYYYLIKGDNYVFRSFSQQLFITVEEERNNKLNDILDES